MATMAIGLLFTAVSGIMKANAARQEGRDANQFAQINAKNTKTAADFQADQLKARATRQVAEGIIRGKEQKLQADYAKSRIIALAGASGGGVLDKNIMDAIVGFEEKGMLNQSLEIYKGNVAGDESLLQASAVTFSGISQADALLYQGATAQAAGNRAADATIVSTAGSMYSTYSKGRGSGMFSRGSSGGVKSGGTSPQTGKGQGSQALL